MSELWSPQMRKWARDAHRHGIHIEIGRNSPRRGDFAGGNAYALQPYVSEDLGSVYVAEDGITSYVQEA